jgi:hypothetical protein
MMTAPAVLEPSIVTAAAETASAEEISVSQRTELTVQTCPAPAVIDRITALLSAHAIRLLAASPLCDNRLTTVMLVVDDGATARALLQEEGFRCVSETVLLIEAPRQIGLFARLGHQLWQEGIGICHSYVFYSERQRVCAVFKTTDDDRALAVLAGQRPAVSGRPPVGQPVCSAAA